MMNSNLVDEQQWPLTIGVDIGGTQMRAAVLQGSTLRSRAGLLTGVETAPERMLPRLFSAIAHSERGHRTGTGRGTARLRQGYASASSQRA